MSTPKWQTCEACGLTKMSKEFRYKRDGTKQPNCKACGNGGKAKPRACSKCGVVKLRSEFNSYRNSKPFPNCKDCGSSVRGCPRDIYRRKKVCTCCNVLKDTCTDFTKIGKTGTNYFDECKVCRADKKEEAKQARILRLKKEREDQKARRIAARKAKELKAQPATLTWKYNGKEHDSIFVKE